MGSDLLEVEKEKIEKDQEFNTIADRIRNRTKAKEIDLTKENNIKEESLPVESGNSSFEGNVNENLEIKTKNNNQMAGRFNTFKDKYTKIDSNIEIIETNVNTEPNFGIKNDKIRNTVNVPSPNYFQNRDNLINKKEDEVQFLKDNPSYLSEPPNMRNSLNENKLKSDFEIRDQIDRSYDNQILRSIENPHLSLLKDELKFMRSQQEKILENQNIFQTYISNEITNIKNRLNQMESNMILSKTLNTANPFRSDMNQF